jgi:hypothetical protein
MGWDNLSSFSPFNCSSRPPRINSISPDFCQFPPLVCIIVMVRILAAHLRTHEQ